ncbi:MAG: sulfurtransferase [Ignavibacteria bacterium]|nr:sulfurtransferase [Ignavibacteria bacterium]
MVNPYRNNVLIEVQELKEIMQLEDVVIIDTRTETEYLEGHIPGALSCHKIFTYLVTHENGGLEIFEREFVEEFSRKGLRNTDHIVIYEDTMANGYGQSCRGHFILHYLGHKEVSILHGGNAAWERAGYPLENSLNFRPAAPFIPRIDSSMIAEKDDVFEAIQKRAPLLLDCRDEVEWVGESSSPYGPDYCPRKGRLPGAVWLEWYNLMTKLDSIPMFRSKSEILQECAKVGITPDTEVIIYCFKGSRASNTQVAMRQAGITRVRNYFASWNEWSRDPMLPIDDRKLPWRNSN